MIQWIKRWWILRRIRHLVQLGDEGVFELSKLLDSDDRRIAGEVIAALSAINSRRSASALIDAMGSDNSWISYWSGLELTEIRNPSMFEMLLDAARSHPDEPTQLAAIQALEESRDHRGLGTLIEVAKSHNLIQTRRAAIEAISAQIPIGPVGLAEVTTVLTDIYENSDSATRRIVISAIPTPTDQPLRRLINKALGDDDRAVVLASLHSLKRTVTPDVLESVLTHSKSIADKWPKDSQIKLATVDVIAKYNDPDAREFLAGEISECFGRLSNLDEQEIRFLLIAVRAIGKSGDSSYLPIFKDVLKDGSPLFDPNVVQSSRIRGSVIKAIGRIGNASVADDLGRLLDDEPALTDESGLARPGVRRLVADALGDIADPAGSNYLASMVSDKYGFFDWEASGLMSWQSSIISALGRINSDLSFNALIQILERELAEYREVSHPDGAARAEHKTLYKAIALTVTSLGNLIQRHPFRRVDAFPILDRYEHIGGANEVYDEVRKVRERIQKS